MVKRIAFVVSLFVCHKAFGQSVSKKEAERAYEHAIKEFLNATNKRDASVFDTLLIGKRRDFPAVTLPARVGNTTVLFLTTKEADKKRKYNNKLVFVNLVGTVTKDISEFMFVTFYPDYVHQYDCIIGLKYNSTSRTFQLDYVNFKNYAYK